MILVHGKTCENFAKTSRENFALHMLAKIMASAAGSVAARPGSPAPPGLGGPRITAVEPPSVVKHTYIFPNRDAYV
jgi:hypothetical protein